MINLPAAHRLRTDSIAVISFEVAIPYRKQLWQMVENSQTEYYNLKISKPKKPRTVGYKSQNHAINGYCQQIAVDTGNSFTAVKERMKVLAISRNYPIETLPDGSVMPKSESEIDTVEAGYLIDAIKQFADEYNIRLIEGDEDEH